MTSVVEEGVRIARLSAELGAKLGDAAWLMELRARAAKLADGLQWPDSRAERPWKYYDASKTDMSRYPTIDGGSIATEGARGATVSLLSEGGDLASKHIGKVVTPETDRFSALHYALLGDAVIIDVPANAEVASAVRINRTFDGAQFAAPHTLIVTGANSHVTVVEEFQSTGEDILAAPVVEIVPGPGSQVRYYAIHSWGGKTKVFMHQRFAGTSRDAAFQNLQLVLGGDVVKGHLESSLIERGTSSELLGVGYGVGSEHADFYTLQDHVGPDTKSDLVYKSALRDHSRSVYYGLTRVGLGAKNADAAQENRNLLLSKTAKADSDPVLEILTADIIRASHGATAGPVDQEQLFYMQARGIPHKDAEAMLVRAFLEAVFGRVPDEALRGELNAKLEAKLV